MTAKENNAELHDKLEYKQELIEKIAYNKRCLNERIQAKAAISREIREGERGIELQEEEKDALSNRILAEQFDVSINSVNYQARQIRDKHQGLSAKKQDKIAKAIVRSRANDTGIDFVKAKKMPEYLEGEDLSFIEGNKRRHA